MGPHVSDTFIICHEKNLNSNDDVFEWIALIFFFWHVAPHYEILWFECVENEYDCLICLLQNIDLKISVTPVNMIASNL